MAYQRFWFHKDLSRPLGGGAINNPGRYLVLLPPINGATAFSGTPYFTASPGDPYKAWDASATLITCRSIHHVEIRIQPRARTSHTSPETWDHASGRKHWPPGSFVEGFTPDLRKRENRFTIAILVKL